MYKYRNASVNVPIDNYSNTISANLRSSFLDETKLVGAFDLNLTKTYSYNGTTQTFAYGFYNGTYMGICVYMYIFRTNIRNIGY